VPQEETPEKQQEVNTFVREKNKRKEHHGRLALPSHLPVEEIILEPEEDTSGTKFIGKEVTDQLELVPAKLFIKRFIRPKYIMATDENQLEHKGVYNGPFFSYYQNESKQADVGFMFTANNLRRINNIVGQERLKEYL
jgi:hypothetical protein